MSVFVDTSVWYAAVDSGDRRSRRAQEILSSSTGTLVTSDHILVETWLLLRRRIHREAAEKFWDGLRSGVANVEHVGAGDLESAWAIGREFPDQDFSIVDRTSFAIMRRLGIRRAASFAADFSIYRFGPDRRQAFDVVP